VVGFLGFGVLVIQKEVNYAEVRKEQLR